MQQQRTAKISTRRFRAIVWLAAGQLLAVGAMAAVLSIDDDAAPEDPAEARIILSVGGD